MKKILLVEDDEKYRKMLLTKLESSGVKVITASSGNEALDRLKLEQIDLILLDLLMPGMSGWNFMYELSKTKNKNIPVIILTNLNEASYPSGVPIVLDFLIKSNMSINEVVDKVNKRLN